MVHVCTEWHKSHAKSQNFQIYGPNGEMCKI